MIVNTSTIAAYVVVNAAGVKEILYLTRVGDGQAVWIQGGIVVPDTLVPTNADGTPASKLGDALLLPPED